MGTWKQWLRQPQRVWLRRAAFQIHLWVGLFIGLYVVVLSLTGSALDFAWTNYGTGNVDTNEVANIIDGDLTINKTLQFGEYIGQHNNGNHTALFTDVDNHLAGTEFPVPIVDHNGNFQGWATFHVTSAVGGSQKDVNGYFVSPFLSARLTVGDQCLLQPRPPQAARVTGIRPRP